MTGAAQFRERALHEALRYGSDPFVLVRELLQNARDAGAGSVAFETAVTAGRVVLTCRDDGLGLDFDEAERSLFTLYASRKTRDDAGRFGVGFWSVLLFEPTRLVVRSWPRKGEPWEAEWDGRLEQARARRPPPGTRGTEVVLERPGEADVADAVFDAAWRHARFLRRRDGKVPLLVTVNGRRVNAELMLPAPSLSFARRGLRGVIGLAAEPRVELYAKGLLVRTAATLDDLLAPGVRGSRPAAGCLPGAAAQFVLDADELDLLLSRGDARSDAALGRVVEAARAELERLLDRQLAAATLPVTRRFRTVAAATALAAAGALAALALPRAGSGDAAVPLRPRVLQAAGPAGLPEADGPAARDVRPETRAYRDPRRTYEGPVLDRADRPLERVALRYEPPVTLHLASMRVLAFGPAGRPRLARDPVGPYRGPACTLECVTVHLTAAGGGWTSLPVPTGHRLDPDSVRVADAPSPPRAAADGTPLVALPDGAALVSYRTGPADEPAPPPDAAELPAALEGVAADLRALPEAARPAAAVRWVRAHVRDVQPGELPDPAVARDDADFAETALARGVGDCDVQNGIVTRLLQASGVPARLAIGYVGVGGSAAAGLHAWVEHRAGGGPWRVEDASGAAAPPAAEPHPRRAADDPPAETPARRWPYAAACAVACAVAAHAFASRRTRRSVHLSDGLDVAALVRGALRHPERVAHAAALFHRALVPCRGGALSLSGAQELADGGALYVARRESPLATRARRQGARVVDGAQAAGRAVADALGAVDLDAWSDRLDATGDGGPLLARVNRGLSGGGARFRVRAGEGVGAPGVLDLPASRDLLVDAATPWLAAARARAERQPAAAALDVAERASDLVGLPRAEQARLLAPFARAALAEAAR
jgi:hypothetical protein